MRGVWLAGLCLVVGVVAAAQSPQSNSDAQIKDEAARAQAIYDKGNFVAALPLFEELHAQRPKDPIYEERLAMSVLGASGGGSAEEIQANNARAKRLLLDAQSLGDNSPLLVTLLEKLSNAEAAGPVGPVLAKTPAQRDFDAAEKLFGKGDLQGALPLYKKSLEEDPGSYFSALYAGDVLFKSGDCPQAMTYYAKAVAIDPDRETAYRYWGDCLAKQGDLASAEGKYIEAVLCQPYQKTTRQMLDQWAKVDGKVIRAPAVKLPAGPTATPGGKKGDVSITLDASKKGDEAASDLMYTMTRALWQGDEFKKHYPKEKQYRHSLSEEAESIRAMLAVAAKKPSDSTKTLMALEKDGMLECWILLDDPDQGIAQDYVAYRKEHRELMHRYIATYDGHPL